MSTYIEPVERAQNLSQGVRVTGGGPPPPPKPQTDDEARKLESALKAADAALAQAYDAGYAAGCAVTGLLMKEALTALEEKKSRPVSRTVKTIHEDSRGHVVSIEEESFRT
jgi:hypothetical protein